MNVLPLKEAPLKTTPLKATPLKKHGVLVSAYGRGHWLAVEMVQRGWTVTLLDVSQKFQTLRLEDIQNPFGLLSSLGLTDSNKEALLSEGGWGVQKEGVSFWFKDHCLELLGPLSKYQIEKQGVSPKTFDYLFGYDNFNSDEIDKYQSELSDDEFSNTWLAHFAHQWSATQFANHNKGFTAKNPLPLFSQFQLRETTRHDLEQSLRWCETKGVKVYRQVDIESINSHGAQINWLKFQSGSSSDHHSTHQMQHLEADSFVWGLSGYETQQMPSFLQSGENTKLSSGSDLCGFLFPEGVVEPEWVWACYGLRFTQGEDHLCLPDHVVMIKDIFMPWCHENICIIQRTSLKDYFYVWVRMEQSDYLKADFIKDMGDKILNQFRSHIPSCKVQISSHPQSKFNLFPVYNKQQLTSFRSPKFVNLYYDGPERWDRLDWAGVFDYQSFLINKIGKGDTPSD